jgi:hypothetical protein
MPVTFTLKERLAGIVLAPPDADGRVPVSATELVGPADLHHLMQRLGAFEGPLFSKIPKLPPRSTIDHLVVLIQKDLRATAYFNELQDVRMQVRLAPGAKASIGGPVFVSDIADVASIELGVPIPADVAVFVLRSHDWKRAIFYDFGPLQSEDAMRQFPIEHALAQQALLLLGLAPGSSAGELTAKTRLEHMSDGLATLRELLDSKCETESRYQELLHEHPWMLGGIYSSVDRHLAMNDENIPDFTAVRCYDGFRDVIELKHPFMKCVRKKRGFTSDFNDAWNQAERYLSFAERQRAYLADAKDLRFENPACILLVGYQLAESALQQIRSKEGMNRHVRVLTYDRLLVTAEHLLQLVSSAGERTISPTGTARSAEAAEAITDARTTIDGAFDR